MTKSDLDGVTTRESNAKRFALCGLGRVSRFHREALEKTPGVRLVAGCDPSPDARRALAPLPTFSDLGTLLTHIDVDVVVVATPNADHAASARIALLHDKDVLLEKPAVTAVADYIDLVRIAEERGRTIDVAYHFQHSPDVVEAAESLAGWEAELGPLSSVSAQFLDPYVGPDGLFPPARSLDGSWADSGINALSVLSSLLPMLRVLDVSRVSEPTTGASDVGAFARVAFESTDGRTRWGAVETNWTRGVSLKTTELLFGRDGVVLRLGHSSHTITMIRPDGTTETVFSAPPTEMPRLSIHYLGVYQRYLEVLAGKRPPTHDATLALHRWLLEM